MSYGFGIDAKLAIKFLYSNSSHLYSKPCLCNVNTQIMWTSLSGFHHTICPDLAISPFPHRIPKLNGHFINTQMNVFKIISVNGHFRTDYTWWRRGKWACVVISTIWLIYIRESGACPINYLEAPVNWKDLVKGVLILKIKDSFSASLKLS